MHIDHMLIQATFDQGRGRKVWYAGRDTNNGDMLFTIHKPEAHKFVLASAADAALARVYSVPGVIDAQILQQ